MNAGIILQGQGVQPVNALSQGAQAGQMINDFKQTNSMRDMYQQHGAGIAQGNQQSLNALAAFDPQAALGVQNTRLDMDNTRQGMQARAQQMQLQLRQEARQVQQAASQASAAERAQLAESLKASVAMGMQAQTPEQWDALMQERNPEYVGMFEQREMLAAEYMSVADSLDRMDANNAGPEPVKPNSSIGKLQSDLASGAINQQQYDLALQNMAPSGMQITSDGEGGFSLTQGAGVGGSGGNGKDLTVDAAKNTGFLIRAQESGSVLDALEGEGTNLGARLKGAVPFGLGNYMQSEEYQQFDQARRDFINAVLRRESGAVIADSEFANAEVQYFPQPGDTPGVIAQKRRNRENAIEGMAVGAGDGVHRIDEPRSPEGAAAAGADISDEDLLSMYSGGN